MFKIEIGDGPQRPETLLLIKFKKLVQVLKDHPLLFFRGFQRLCFGLKRLSLCHKLLISNP